MRLQVREQASQVARLFDHRPGSFFDVHPHLIGYNAAQGGFAQSRRAMKKHMVQCLSAQLGSFDKYFEVLNDLSLSRKIIYLCGTDIIFELFISGG